MLEHSNSSGGNTTIEMLSVESGYWRATAVSANVFECYNPDACLGGLTGETAYCLEGYEGPCKWHRARVLVVDMVVYSSVN